MTEAPKAEPTKVRVRLVVTGVVQGVGFRPFVHRLAARHGISGLVRNLASSVEIEAEGAERALGDFMQALEREAPPLACIEAITSARAPLCGEPEFRIEHSQSKAEASVRIPPDVGTCADCARELFDERDRRHRHPFVNCTSCGPRLTIVTGAPYDRERTTMASFPMCAACRKEYDNPSDRRFHAQPVACRACGPELRATDARGDRIDVPDAIEHVAQRLREGAIAAVKGIGGYHLACDASLQRAVIELRRRKQRDEKPFALMVESTERARGLCEISEAERSHLESPVRPIVLLRRKPDARVAAAVAPDNPLLGVMLPYSPVHLLLLGAFGGPLVMTSGNRSDEPVAFEDSDALARLGDIADLFLLHDRPIRLRCEDSVLRIVGVDPLLLRRSRGYAPLSVPLTHGLSRPTLALGGDLKSVFALGRDRYSAVSPHLGDLEELSAHQAFEDAIAHFEHLFEISAERIVHDLHPDYASTRYAIERKRRDGLDAIAVQHHHAHMASCLGEHGVEGPALGVCFDGSGYGLDGAIWGGEFLVGTAAAVERAGHLSYAGLPGGDRAIREPWRSAVAELSLASIDPMRTALGARVGSQKIRLVQRMLERGLNSPPTSSAGRLFDAVAALCNVRDVTSFEAQAAVELEALATEVEDGPSYEIQISEGVPLVAHSAPIVRGVVADLDRGAPRAWIARRFHSSIALLVTRVCEQLRERYRVRTVVLSGGVFCNALLAREATDGLERMGFRVHRQRSFPPNDGGLCFGQLNVLAARDALVRHGVR
jgi:hydrogenase maturation protein HypF